MSNLNHEDLAHALLSWGDNGAPHEGVELACPGDVSGADASQVGGDHYHRLGAFQPWNVLQAWLTPEEYRGWQKGVAIVYLARERQKGGDQDIAKAAHHLDKLLEVLSA